MIFALPVMVKFKYFCSEKRYNGGKKIVIDYFEWVRNFNSWHTP